MALGILISIVLKLPPEGVALSVLGGNVAGLIFDVGLLRYKMTLPMRAMDFVVQILPIAFTSGVMFLFVSGVKQVALTHGIATATLPMLAALSHKRSAVICWRPYRYGRMHNSVSGVRTMP